MKHLKVFAFLRSMENKEYQLFHKWLLSTLHNSNKSLPVLFHYLQRSAPNFDAPRLKPERVHKYLFPTKVYKSNTLRKLYSELIKQLMDFWVDQDSQSNPRLKELNCWRILKQRQLQHYTPARIDALRSQLFEQDYQKEAQNLNRYWFSVQEHEDIIEEGQRDTEPKLQPVSDTLDRFFIYQKLKHYCSALTQMRFQETSYKFQFIEEVIDLAGSAPYRKFKGIQFYLLSIQSMLKEGEQAEMAYREMKHLLFHDLRASDRDDMQSMLRLARNFCIQQINQRRKDYIQEVFEIYQLEIDEGLIYSDGKIAKATYKNIGTAAMLLHEYEWLDNFIEQNRYSVEEGAYFFNLASLRFSQKRFEEAVDLFNKAEHQEVLMNLSVKAWLLKSYYELWLLHPNDMHQEDRLEAHITAFTTFLNRKKAVLPDHYLFHLNLGRFVREMLRYSRPYQSDTEKLTDLLERVKASRHIAERRWLIAKINGLLT